MKQISRPAILLLCSIVVCVAGCDGDIASNAAEVDVAVNSELASAGDGHEHELLIFQDEDEAVAADIELAAKEKGLPVADVRRSIEFHEFFSARFDDIAERFPGQVAGVWVDPVPATKGYVRFVGEVPVEATRMIDDMPMLGSISLVGGGRFSGEEQVARSEFAVRAIADLGIEYASGFYDPSRDVIRLQLQVPKGAEPDENEAMIADTKNYIVAQLRTSSGLDALVSVDDFEISVVESDEPMFEDQHCRGGNYLRDDGIRECTSGWSVKGPDGDGIITAAHCTGLNQFEQPGVTPYSMSFKSQVYGTGGDVEYHTTSHGEYAEFYANAIVIRDVTATRSTQTMVGRTVCIYGRFSNVRSCDHEVTAINVAASNGTIITTNLAKTNHVTTTGGDSGGGWSWGTTAWGVHKGVRNSTSESFFTPIRQAESALGVTVKKK